MDKKSYGDRRETTRNQSITKTCPCNIQRFLKLLKMKIFGTKKNDIFLIFAPKHRLWVLVRTKAVLTSTHNLCFGAK